MKIERITIRRICNPIKRPYITAFGSQSAFNSILVSLESEGRTGWGEAAPGGGPLFSPYTDHTSYIIARDFIAPCLLGRELKSGEELQELLKRSAAICTRKRHSMRRCGIFWHAGKASRSIG